MGTFRGLVALALIVGSGCQGTFDLSEGQFADGSTAACADGSCRTEQACRTCGADCGACLDGAPPPDVHKPSSAKPPSAPLIGTARAGGNGTAFVDFEVPAHDNSSSKVVEYRVSAAPGTMTATGLSSPVLVDGLVDKVAYTFTVAARNGGGWSPESAESNPVVPLSIQDVSYWKDKYDAVFDTAHREVTEHTTSDDSWQFYRAAYYLDAATTMFEAAGRASDLDYALGYVQNTIDTADPSSTRSDSNYDDSYLGWGQYSHPRQPEENDGKEYPLYESYFFRYAARLLRVATTSPVCTDPNNARYSKSRVTKVDNQLAFIRTNIFEKWRSRGAHHLYRSRTHMASHWAYIALELLAIDPKHPDAPVWRQVVDNIDGNEGSLPTYHGESLRGQLTEVTAPDGRVAYRWHSDWPDTRVQDTSHGNNVISYLSEAERIGLYWTPEDMRKMSVTLDQLIWPAAGSYADYVDGSGSGNGWLNDGFLKLGRYDVALQERLQDHSVASNTQHYAHMAMSAALLTGQR